MALENPILVSVIFAGVLAQLMKVITRSFKKGTLTFESLFDMGGMPSGHSAFVSSLAIATGISEGFNSTIFVVVLVFALVIMYDATGIRRSAGIHGKVLNSLIKVHKMKSTRLKEELGHSPFEVIVGSILGVLCAIYIGVFI